MIYPELFNIINSYLDSLVVRHLSVEISNILNPINTTNANYFLDSNDIYNIGYYVSNGRDLYQIACYGLKEGNLKIVYEMIRKKVKEIDQITNNAAKRGYKELVDFTIKYYGINNWDAIAENAAEGGHKDILYDMINNHGVDNWNNIACSAALGGHKDIVYDMINNHDADNWDAIAESAAEGGSKDILLDMIDRGIDSIQYVTEIASKHGHRELIATLIDLTLKANATVDYCGILCIAIHGGYRDIYNDYINKVTQDEYGFIACAAAEAGQLDIVISMIDQGYNELDDIVDAAAEYQQQHIIDEMIKRGAIFQY